MYDICMYDMCMYDRDHYLVKLRARKKTLPFSTGTPSALCVGSGHLVGIYKNY